MTATLTRTRAVGDQLLHQVAVDPAFRAELEADPAAFGAASHEFNLPASVQGQDESFLEALGDEMQGLDIFACASTCSFGPFTIICDGNTKSG